MSDDRLAGFDFFQEIDFGPLEPDTEGSPLIFHAIRATYEPCSISVLDIPDEHVPPDPDDADCKLKTSHLQPMHPPPLDRSPISNAYILPLRQPHKT